MALPTGLTTFTPIQHASYHTEIDNVMRWLGLPASLTTSSSGHVTHHNTLHSYISKGLSSVTIGKLGHVSSHNQIHQLCNAITLRSGLRWRSGAHTGSFEQDYADFETWRSKLLDANIQYSDRGSWSGVEDPWPLGHTWPGEMILASPMWPEGSGGSFSQVTAGTNDSHYQTLGTNLVNAGFPDQLISLAWEMNGVGWEWDAVGNETAYINAYRRIVDRVHVTAPRVRFAWVINGDTPDPTSMYPGDAYVDVVGVDDYDMWPKVTTDSQWNTEIASVAGLQWTADFATTHGKPLLLQEWGLAGPADANHGGDNQFFITKMQDWFRSHETVLYAENYFDATGGTQSSLFNPGENPNSATTYVAGLHN